MSVKKLKYLIFDLGGVIVDLDMQKTYHQLGAISGLHPDKIKTDYWGLEPFKLYETGRISDDEFRSFLRDFLKFEGDDQLLDEAWNAMILGVPAEKLALLQRLRKDHELFLLSNTNFIHMNCVRQKLLPHGVDSFDNFFDKQYYSHLINMRKPDTEIYQYVLDDNNLDPKYTLFIDDNADNIKGAANLGIQTLHVNHEEALTNFFNE